MDDLYQLFDAVSSTFTYVLTDAETGEAVIIDPVDTHLDEYLRLLKTHALKLVLVLETHAHADHITSAGALCQLTGAKAATPMHCHITPAEIQLVDGEVLSFGHGQRIVAIHTPGHTSGAMTFFWNGRLFTGDTLLINGCGRTDFQSGDAGALYDSITAKLFSFPDDTVVCPGHDYHGQTASTIGRERAGNARLAGRSRQGFIELMAGLNLPKPYRLETAVPANQKLGMDIRHAAE